MVLVVGTHRVGGVLSCRKRAGGGTWRESSIFFALATEELYAETEANSQWSNSACTRVRLS